MKRFALALNLSAVVAAFPIGLGACSSGGVASPAPASPSGTFAPGDGGTPPHEMHDMPGPQDSGGPDSEAALNGCTTFIDQTADTAARTIDWVRSVGTVCYRIKKGQTMTWNPKDTSFSAHPLRLDAGSMGSPIVNQSTGSTPFGATFAATGTFGFSCGFHPDMMGAISVVP